MNIQELMIGDFVKVKDSNEIIKVEEIIKLHNGFGINGDWEGYELINWYNSDSIEPIPITFAILEESGFSRAEDGYYGDENSVLILQPSGGWACCFDGVRTISGYFEFVHELQHVVKTSGINKQIKV